MVKQNILVTLDIQFFAGEKTEKATPKKRQDSRKKGQVLKSQDVTSAIVLLAIFLYLTFMAGSMKDEMMSFFREIIAHNMTLETITISSVMEMYWDILKELAIIVVPIFAIAVIAAIAANFMQFGLLFTTETLKFDLKKIDPIKGLKRIVSLKAIVELLKSILKISFIGTTTFLILYLNIEDVLSLAHKTPGAALITVGKLVAYMGIAASLVLICIAILDYMYQKYDYEKNLRMSKQDIKDEYKNIEGDPLIKSKIKQRQREMSMRRMMQEVPQADVVITNPTHYAIALKYDEDAMDAPKVVAKGTDFVAQKIKLIAKENKVVMVENRPLARAMYDQVKINDRIPEDFFKAVAEVLAYVYRIKRKI